MGWHVPLSSERSHSSNSVERDGRVRLLEGFSSSVSGAPVNAPDGFLAYGWRGRHDGADDRTP